jgi:hypothetical protein
LLDAERVGEHKPNHHKPDVEYSIYPLIASKGFYLSPTNAWSTPAFNAGKVLV